MQCKFLIHVIAICLITFVMEGCSLFQDYPHPISIPKVQLTKEILSDIRRQAQAIKNIHANSRIKITTPDNSFPSVKSEIYWTRGVKNDRSITRTIGKAVMGMTVFDSLCLPDNIYLYIPSHDAVYFANLNDNFKNYTIKELNSAISLAFNPWSAALMPMSKPTLCRGEENSDNIKKQETYHNGQVCLSFPSSKGKGIARFTRSNLEPVSINLPYADIFFDFTIDNKQNQLLFPDIITFKLKEPVMKIDIKIKKIDFNSGFKAAQIFDFAPFLRHNILPLQSLI